MNEIIANDTNGNNGSIGYTYDPVGNRTQQTSTSAAITSGTFGYDADDRLTTDVYDANGNTISSGGQGITYDFENRILTENGATYLYDGDGNRVQKTVAGLNTLYTIVTVNPTGYPQVGHVQYSGSGTHDNYRAWALGLEREGNIGVTWRTASRWRSAITCGTGTGAHVR